MAERNRSLVFGPGCGIRASEYIAFLALPLGWFAGVAACFNLAFSDGDAFGVSVTDIDHMGLALGVKMGESVVGS